MLKFTAGSNKGKVEQGNVFNDPFALKQQNNEDGNYTNSKVVISGDGTSSTVSSITLDWSPVVPGTVVLTYGGATYADIDRDGKLYKLSSFTTKEVTDAKGNVTIVIDGTKEDSTQDATVTYGTTADGRVTSFTHDGVTTSRYDVDNLPNNGNKVDPSITIKGSIGTFADDLSGGLTGPYTVSYVYNNIYIPQNDIPLLNAEMAAIPLVAHARRIAVYYSNLAAFQAKTDYGFDMGQSLADQAVAQLSYEIDTEIVNGLHEAASTNTDAATVLPMLTFSKTLPIGVSMQEHFASFSNIIEKGKAVVYKRTKRFSPTYMVIAADIMPVLAFVPGFKAASTSGINGPYFAGTVGGLKVFVSPALEDGVFFFGVNGSDAQTSAAVYAPYMAIVPTQLLGFADGAMSQGFSTLYDFKILNPLLLAEGRVTE